MARRCFCPPESRTPFSPGLESYLRSARHAPSVLGAEPLVSLPRMSQRRGHLSQASSVVMQRHRLDSRRVGTTENCAS
eukprot:1132623-Rhodomonas_salina.1